MPNRQGATAGSFRITPGDAASQWRYGPFLPVLAMTNVLAMTARQEPPLREETAQNKTQGATAWLKRLWPLALLVAAAVLVLAMGWQKNLSLENLAENRAALRAFIDANMVLAILGFVALYAVVVALSLPGGAVLTLAGGLLFGWLVGGIASVIGATLGAVCVFLIAKSALSDILAAKAGPWLDRFRQGFQQDAFNYLLFLRLVPIFPFWLVNLAPGLLGVSFGTYVITTILGIIPGTFAYSLAGNGLDSVIEAQQAAHQSCLAKMGAGGQESCPYALDPGALLTPELIAGLVALGLVALVPVLVKWFRRRAA
ncbi:MAG: TVP38/TMEM64 family protein [Methyloceanibacter sp.]